MRHFLSESIKSVGTAAMLLALSRTIRDEDEIKKMLNEKGFKYAVTEVGGHSALGEFQTKTTKAIVGACLNNNLFVKSPQNIHALIHAAEEAKRGILVNTASHSSLAVKISIVHDTEWIAVAMFGDSALHSLTNHERAGLGIMHLGK